MPPPYLYFSLSNFDINIVIYPLYLASEHT
nr:MAG TPA: hypothetical protein [Crassvirales sp.]